MNAVLFRVELYVSDIERSYCFYKEILGLELFGRNEKSLRFNYESFSLLIASHDLLESNHYLKRERNVGSVGGGVELIVVVPSIEDIYRNCQEKRYPIEVGIESYEWGMRGFKLVDPDGYFIRVTSK